MGNSLDCEDHCTLDESAVQSEVQRCLNCACVAVNASDLAPALVALGAKIRTTKQVLAAADFFSMSPNLEQDEIVKEIEIPAMFTKIHRAITNSEFEIPLISQL